MFDPDKTATMGSAKDPQYDEFAAQAVKKSPQPQAKTNFVIDETKSKLLIQQIRDNQNLSMGIVGGLGAAIIGSVVWAAITALTLYQIGFMAIGIGFLVGFAVRKMGQGVDKVFGYLGAGLAFLGCAAGNLFTTCIIISNQEGIPISQILSNLNVNAVAELMKYTFSPIDLLFYGLAIYYGYKFSFRQLTPEELRSITKPANS
ncbi:MAG TPA: hypothetical protein VHP63_05360 [candidate division Zixibacteria bacterium]|nr:hypothetical protein [candidate division Zixibacteria bacterium]